MNIPGDELYNLLNTALKNRGQETLQRTLYLSLREYILSGRLQSGSRLSGSRTLAGHLSLSRNTVNGALEQLTLEGYLLRSRKGTRVAPLAARQLAQDLPAPAVALAGRVSALPAPVPRSTPVLAFTPGTPAINYFPCRSGGACTIACCGRRKYPVGLRRSPGNLLCGRPLPATLRFPAGLTATPARL